MADYEELVARLRSQARLERYYHTTGKTSDDAADAIEELQSYADLYKELTEKGQTVARKLIDAYPKWISVEERLPEDKETCLIWYEYFHYSLERVLPEYGIGFYLSMYDMWYGDPSTGKDVKVLYWMPLPEPPGKKVTADG